MHAVHAMFCETRLPANHPRGINPKELGEKRGFSLVIFKYAATGSMEPPFVDFPPNVPGLLLQLVYG